jgi:hemerythrin
MFVWDDGYLLGDPDIDSEHRALFRLAQTLERAVEEQRETAELESLLAQLAAYTRFHFTGEEALMRKVGYPGLAQQQAEHRTLTDKVEALAADLAKGSPKAGRAVLQFLDRWLESHLTTADRAFGDFLKAKRT